MSKTCFLDKVSKYSFSLHREIIACTEEFFPKEKNPNAKKKILAVRIKKFQRRNPLTSFALKNVSLDHENIFLASVKKLFL